MFRRVPSRSGFVLGSLVLRREYGERWNYRLSF
jgi:hypothetical protein